MGAARILIIFECSPITKCLIDLGSWIIGWITIIKLNTVLISRYHSGWEKPVRQLLSRLNNTQGGGSHHGKQVEQTLHSSSKSQKSLRPEAVMIPRSDVNLRPDANLRPNASNAS